jgi:membrane dipeptidase
MTCPIPADIEQNPFRRRFLGNMGAAMAGLVVAGNLPLASSAATPTPRPATSRIVINALGGLDNPNVDHEGDASAITRGLRKRMALDARTLRDAHASGVTAVNWTLGYVAGEGDPYEVTVSDIARFDRMVRDHAADVTKVFTAANIVQAKRDGKIGIIYGFQNGLMLGDKPERVDVFADLGVRVFQLTYNPANTLGDGSMAPQNRGLTPLGREIVARLNDNRVMVDLSHSGQNTCLEAARLSRQPVSINHTGCRALTDLPRNKTDEELRLVADKGGFVGIYFMPFLRRDGRITGADVVDHIEHAINVCGEDHVGIGTDGSITQIDDMAAYRGKLAKEVEERRKAGIGAAGEGPDTLPFAIDMRGPTQFTDLAQRLQARGHSADRVDKILGGNFLRYAQDVWGA